MRNLCVVFVRSLLACLVLLYAAAIVGCGSALTPTVVTPPVTAPSPVISFSGHVYAGQQPVSGSSVTLYAAGTTGNGTGATNLMSTQTVSTDSTGLFQIPANFTCPTSTTQTYLVAKGGTPGVATGTANSALVLLAVLGDCGNLANAGSPIVNEATTAAAAWALSPFLGAGADIGSPSTNAAGLRNAFSLALNLVSSSTGTAPGAGLPASAKLETAKLNTLADALAGCSRSSGGAGCSLLFNAATRNSVVPATILDASLSIVRNPALNTTAVFTAAAGQTAFLPQLSAAPHDWTLSVTYGNCASGCGGLSTPGSLAIDSTGNVWVANYFGGVVSRFSATGVAAAANGFPGTGLTQTYGITVDNLDNAWVSNRQSVTAANNHRYGSVSKFSPAGVELSGAGFTGGGVYYPKAVAADPAGLIWTADYGSSSATLLANDGTAISSATGYAVSQLPFAEAVAMDGSRNAWFAVQGAVVRVNPQGSATSFPCCNDPEGIAIDPAGDVWIADYGGYSITELSSSGALLHRIGTSAGSVAPLGIVSDGSGNIWTANYFGNSITAVAGAAGTMTSPPAGLGLDAPLNEPYGIAVDSMGSLWVSNSGNSTLTQLLGLASPVRTPLLGPPAQP